MVAKHKPEDETEITIDIQSGGLIEIPTWAAHGLCIQCGGEGKVPDPDHFSRKEWCTNCGGDGKSELEE